jgi:hypothetical protein
VECANGCTDNDEVTVTENTDYPTVNIIPDGGELACTTTFIILTADTTGSGCSVTGYQWYKDDVALSGETGTTLNVISPGDYKVEVECANGCTDDDEVTVTENTDYPTVNITPDGGELTCATTFIILTADTTGSACSVTGYQWYKDDVALSGETGTTLNVISPGDYKVEVECVNGCTDDDEVIVTQNTTLPKATASSNSPVSQGATIQLYGGPDGMTSYDWTGPGGWTSTLQNPIRTGATTAMAGTYTLTVTNSDGCIDNVSTSVTISATVLPYKTDYICGCFMISSTEGGSVTTPGEGDFCYICGTVVDLVASPDPGYEFVNWTGNVDFIADVYNASTTITTYGNYEIIATFQVEEVPTPVYPKVTTQIATWVSVDSATLNMDYTVADFSPVQVRFAYKKSTDSSWAYTDWVSKSGDGTHAEMLTGLTSQTEYDFKAQLKYNGTLIEGTTLQFTTDTPSTPPPSRDCFIATAAYGTPTAEQIDVLREFRDSVLLESDAGSQFVTLYYQLSPPIADFIAGNEILRTLVRELLVDPFVWIVEATGEMWRN